MEFINSPLRYKGVVFLKKLTYTMLGVLLLIIVVIQFFNISLTSLPTDFSNVVNKYSEKYEDGSSIKEIKVGDPYDYEVEVLVIEEKEEINTLLNLGVEVYDGGRFPERGKEIEMIIVFENGNSHRYLVAEKYIAVGETVTSIEIQAKKFKVLDNNNEIYNQLEALYNQ